MTPEGKKAYWPSSFLVQKIALRQWHITDRFLERHCNFRKRSVNEYLLKLPELEWVVYQLSPRVVSVYHEDSTNKRLLRSRGFSFDRDNSDALRQPPKEQKMTVEELTSIPYVADYWQENPWGSQSDDDVWDNPKTKRKWKQRWKISEKALESSGSDDDRLERKRNSGFVVLVTHPPEYS